MLRTSLLPRPRRGFTLVELLVVIAVIIILAAISFTAVGVLSRQGNRKKAETQFQLLASGLDLYRAEAGAYPQHTGTPEDGSKVVYQALSGNGDDQLGGSTPPSANPRRQDLLREPYVPELLPGSDGKQKWLSSTYPFQIVDPWNERWNYLSGNPGNQDNAGYDLWSRAGAGLDSQKWIGNRKS